MKKKIGFIALDSSLAGWLYEKLRTSAPDTPAAKDLTEGLEELMTGSADSLMLELGETDTMMPSGDSISCGALSIDLRLRRVIRDGREIALTPKEFDILYFLARNRGRYLPKSRSIRRCGSGITCWMTAISWPSSENSARRSNPIPMHRNTF